MTGLVNKFGNGIQLGNIIGDGGEAQVYELSGNPKVVAKVYKQPTSERQLKLSWMVEHPPLVSATAGEHPSIAWPSVLLFRHGGAFAGFLMPRIDKAATIFEVQNPVQRKKAFPSWAGDREWARLMRVARNLASVVSLVHCAGHIIGDINEGNTLVTADGLVTLIDTDSFQVRVVNDGRSTTYRSLVGREPYTPPELQGARFADIDRTELHDRFGLAVIIFQLLMEGNHPFRAEWTGAGDPPTPGMRIKMGSYPHQPHPTAPVKPSSLMPAITILPPRIVTLFEQCFVNGHSDPIQRPSAADWETAIHQSESELARFTNGHVYGRHLPSCPWCVRDAKLAPVRSAQQRSISGIPRHAPSANPLIMMSAKPQFRNFKADIRGAAKPLIGLVVFAVIAIRLLASAFGSDGVSLDVAQTGWREVQLTWSEHDEAVRYRIYYIVPPSSEPILEDSIEREYTGMTYDIVHDGRYCFWIEAVISSDEVEKSNEECVTVE